MGEKGKLIITDTWTASALCLVELGRFNAAELQSNKTQPVRAEMAKCLCMSFPFIDS
jgi:hypothetical protein